MPKASPTENGRQVTKSDAIRDELAKNPAAGSQDIITALGAKGVKVAPSLIYFVKSKLRQAKKKAKRERVAESSRSTASTNPVELVIRVKNLAREVGGVKNLKQLVDLLAE